MAREVSRSSGLKPSPAIMNLSHDVLYEIFLILARDSCGHHAPLNRSNINKTRTWVSVTYTCRRWRHLALMSPNLWTMIHIFGDCSIAMLREYLHRSGDCKLGFWLSGLAYTPQSVLKMAAMAQEIASHASRIESVCIKYSDVAELQIILAPFTTPAASLRSFLLTLDDTHPGSHVILPCPFGGDMPSLHSMKITYGAMNWCRYTNMTALVLVNQAPPPLWEFVDTLRQSPNLQTLTIGFASANFPSPEDKMPSYCWDLVTLPHLKRLVLSGTCVIMQELLPWISYPNVRSLEMNFSVPGPVNHIHRRGCHSPVLQLNCTTAEVALCESDYGSKYIGIKWGNKAVIRWIWRFSSDASARHPFSHITDIISLSSIRHLTITDVNSPLSRECWAGFFKLMPSLQSLTLETLSMSDFDVINALAQFSPGEPGQPPCIEVCPGLSRFVVNRPIVMDEMQRDMKLLLAPFQNRVLSGLPLLDIFQVTMRTEDNRAVIVNSHKVAKNMRISFGGTSLDFVSASVSYDQNVSVTNNMGNMSITVG